MKKSILFLLICLLGCDFTPSSDQKMAEKTEKAMQQASSEVGMPAIKNFTELRLARSIYEMRDDAKLQTWSYTTDMTGKRHLLCNSFGYGLPYATQFSNPEHIVNYYSTAYMALPQAEPNGLFMPSTAEGTWVICIDPSDKQPKPVYVEDRVIVSPFELKNPEVPEQNISVKSNIK